MQAHQRGSVNGPGTEAKDRLSVYSSTLLSFEYHYSFSAGAHDSSLNHMNFINIGVPAACHMHDDIVEPRLAWSCC